MKKIHIVSLHGSYFANNYGDILLINIFYNWINNFDPSLQINLPLVDKKKIQGMPEPTSTGLLRFVKSDCLIYCGGGYFGEKPHNSNLWAVRNFCRHAIIGLIAVLFRIPIAIIGVEIGPISNNWFRRVVLLLVKKSRIVLVRNEESLAFLERYGIKNAVITADAVLTLNEDAPAPSQNMDDYIIFHIPGYAIAKTELDILVKTVCAGLLSTNRKYQIKFLEDLPGQYDSNYEKLFHILKENSIDYSVQYYTGINDVMQTIKNASAVFTTKLHVGITAAAFNRRVFSLYTHPKTKRFHHQIGNDDYCFSIKEIENITKEKIIDFLDSKPHLLPRNVLSSSLYNKKMLETFIKESIESITL